MIVTLCDNICSCFNQIIMMYNKNVTGVTFHIDPGLDEQEITASIQRKLDAWSRSVCPEWSRIVVAPYSVEIIPHERKRRSLERSRDRNQMVQSMRNWEIDWILKN